MQLATNREFKCNWQRQPYVIGEAYCKRAYCHFGLCVKRGISFMRKDGYLAIYISAAMHRSHINGASLARTSVELYHCYSRPTASSLS